MLNLSLSSGLALQNPKLCFHHHDYTLSSRFSLAGVTPTVSFTLLNRKTTSFSSSSYKNLSLKCRYSDQQQQKFSANDSSFSPQSGGGMPSRVYVGHSIYKGKAALTVEPRSPEFAPLDSGAYKLAREGYVLLQFAPAAGVRQYDWSRKQVFSLSVSEMGTLISLGAKESCDFFHDPFKGKSDEGKVRKVFRVEPLPDGSGHFFNLNVQNKLTNVDESIYIPISKGEYTILTSAFNFIVPYLIGWHTFANSVRPEDTARFNNANPRSGADYEWSR